jgi:hypothetical protein
VFVIIRDRSRGVANIRNMLLMLLSNIGEDPCEYKNLKFAANSPKMIWLTWRNTEKTRPYKWLQMIAYVLQMPLQMLRMPTNALANVTNAYECLTNETTTQRMRGELHINLSTMLLNMVESIKSHENAPKHGNMSAKKLKILPKHG